jgi:type IV pilus biogenesis protein PilP
MQNNKISLATLFFISFLCLSASVAAQEPAKVTEGTKETVKTLVKEKRATDVKIPQLPTVNPVAGQKDEKALAVSNIVSLKPVAPTADNVQDKINSVREQNKIRLEEELKNTEVGNKTIVDFPNRPSLGALELAPLPGISETVIGGPLPMAPSVSGKDLPSEQLLGRITPEVFQEMADLERGNTFLKLQLEKEKLKNDLEKLKATYRSTRLDEISKRENVVRSRIQWWQEQEKLRLEIEKKQAEEEELARKIAEQEEAREKLRAEKMNEPKEVQKVETVQKQETKKPVMTEAPLSSMEELYVLDSIRGIGKNLSATLKIKEDGSVIVVKKDDILPSGHVVQEIKKGIVTVAYGNRIDQLVFRPAAK